MVVARNGAGKPRSVAVDFTAKARPTVNGKFLFLGKEKLLVRGVTYGTFRPDEQGQEFPSRDRVEEDFTQMAANGINAVRTYTPPPPWLLDAAQRHGLRVMVGLPVERSIAFLDYRECARSIEEMVRAAVRSLAGHRAILCYTIGNEIPASIVRWHGARKLERFLHRLCRVVKAEDPDGLVTYVNYPSTEYLELPFLDFVCFNVYLESQPCLDAYLARLHNLAGDRPLVMAELGLDSLRHGQANQAHVLDWQVRTAFASGCAGVFVYAWTDEWFRGGAEVEDWAFGLTTRDRFPKPALTSVREAFAEVPFAPSLLWPRITVIVCSYNGARTIRATCEALLQLDYPDYQVIVVDDGSTDDTAAIVRAYDYTLIRTRNRGLSCARNVGLQAAKGEIVAYLDDDAYPDRHWLRYLAAAFASPANVKHAAIGGPNVPPPGDELVAQCVAHAPGGPIHVLLSDREAEHIPGCNMAFRKSCLEAIGGFDAQFRVAGDDVDVCWRLQQEGWTLGFSPAAVVWHRRRNSVRAYWRQQQGYGRAEAMLERKWPDKFNGVGHATWSGRIYGNGAPYLPWRTGRIYHGTWGTAPFQSLYQPAPNGIESLAMIPEWHLLIIVLLLLSGLGVIWAPLRLAIPLLALAIAAPATTAARSAARACFADAPSSRLERLWRRVLTAGLHLLQPVARLSGRLRQGLTLWRQRVVTGFALPRRWSADLWSQRSLGVEERLRAVERALLSQSARPQRGGDYDHWDLEVCGGPLGAARLFMAVEYHGDGRQLMRIRWSPRCSIGGLALTGLFLGLSLGAGRDQCWAVAGVLGGVALLLVAVMLRDCAAATGAFLAAVRKIEKDEKHEQGG